MMAIISAICCTDEVLGQLENLASPPGASNRVRRWHIEGSAWNRPHKDGSENSQGVWASVRATKIAALGGCRLEKQTNRHRCQEVGACGAGSPGWDASPLRSSCQISGLLFDGMLNALFRRKLLLRTGNGSRLFQSGNFKSRGSEARHVRDMSTWEILAAPMDVLGAFRDTRRKRTHG